MYQRVAAATVAALLLITASSVFAQSIDSDPSMLQDARAAVDGRSAPQETVVDRYVAPATFDVGAPETRSTIDQPKVGAAKTSSKLLPPRPTSMRQPAEGSGSTSPGSPKLQFPSAATLVGSTCVVLSLFFAVAWLLKRAAPKSMQSLPPGAIEVLGRAPLVRGQHLQLVRCGQRLLLLAVSSTAAQTLTEISNPQEVDALLSACGGKHASRAPQENSYPVSRDEHFAKADRVGELLATVTGAGGGRERARGGRHG